MSVRRAAVVALLAGLGCGGPAAPVDEPEGAVVASAPEPAAAPCPAPTPGDTVIRAVSGPGVGAYGCRLARVGGHGGTRRVDLFDLSTSTWTEGPPLREARQHPGVAGDGRRLVAVGGVRGSGDTATAEVLAPGATEWAALPSLPAPVRGVGLAFDGADLIALGGEVGGGGGRSLARDVYVLRAGATAWEVGVPMTTGATQVPAVMFEGALWTFGGGGVGGTFGAPLGLVASFAEGAWAARGSLPREGRHVYGACAAVVFDDAVYVFPGGAMDADHGPAVWDGAAWRHTGRRPADAGAIEGAARIGDVIVVLTTRVEAQESRVYAYAPRDDRWTRL